MRIHSILLGVALVFSGITSSTLHGVEPSSSSLSISVSLSPAPSTPDTYFCKAEVIDLSTKAVLAKPQFTNHRGEASKAETRTKDYEIAFEVSLNKEGTLGEYVVTCQKYGKVVSIHKGSVTLR